MGEEQLKTIGFAVSAIEGLVELVHQLRCTKKDETPSEAEYRDNLLSASITVRDQLQCIIKDADA